MGASLDSGRETANEVLTELTFKGDFKDLKPEEQEVFKKLASEFVKTFEVDSASEDLLKTVSILQGCLECFEVSAQVPNGVADRTRVALGDVFASAFYKGDSRQFSDAMRYYEAAESSLSSINNFPVSKLSGLPRVPEDLSSVQLDLVNNQYEVIEKMARLQAERKPGSQHNTRLKANAVFQVLSAASSQDPFAGVGMGGVSP